MYMTEYTTIVVDRDLKAKLDLLKMHPRESYREVIQRMANEHTEETALKQFVRVAQMKKMKEVWDNERDNNSAWQRI
jgi:hypothetical protein